MDMLTPTDARRRWFGSFFLLMALGSLVWGITLLNGYLMRHPVLFVCYWAACALFTGLAMINAMLDMMIMRRRTRDEQMHLAERSFGDLEERKKKRG
jgi:hypothetical protein